MGRHCTYLYSFLPKKTEGGFGAQTGATSPNLYCAQPMLPSFNVHSLRPSSSPAAPAPTNIGSRCSKVGCACLASGLFRSCAILSSLPPAGPVTASLSASSKLTVNDIGSGRVLATRASRRLCTDIPETMICTFRSRRAETAWPRR